MLEKMLLVRVLECWRCWGDTGETQRMGSVEALLGSGRVVLLVWKRHIDQCRRVCNQKATGSVEMRFIRRLM